MIPLLTAEQVRQAEKAKVSEGRTESELMLAAGTGIADALRQTYAERSGSIVVLAGPGKNGGDGLVVADQLAQQGWRVSVWAYQRSGAGNAPISSEFADRVSWLRSADQISAALSHSVVVLDAVFGLSGRAEIPDQVREVFDLVRDHRSRHGVSIWALDVPSGLDVDTGEIAGSSLAADVTAMIGLPKIGVYKLPAARYTGRVITIDIGLEPPSGLADNVPSLLTRNDARAVLREPRTGDYKWSVGTVLVVGGAPNYYGAPRLTGEAALRSGAGLVVVAAPASLIASIATAVPELTFLPLPVAEHGAAGERMAALVRDRLKDLDSLVIGPGLGTDPPVPDFLSRLFGFSAGSRRGIGFGQIAEEDDEQEFTGKAVVDADALNWLATQPDWPDRLAEAELVMTPHPGELARLLGKEPDEVKRDPWNHALEAAQKFRQVVALKYAHSVVATPDGRLMVAPHAPPALATAGTGDVLAGVIGALLAQGMSAEDAACAGMLVGLIATDLAERSTGSLGMVASDIIGQLPNAQMEITSTQR